MDTLIDTGELNADGTRKLKVEKQKLDLSAEKTLVFASYLRSNGYDLIVPIDDQYYACLCRFAYTCAILKGRWFDQASYEDRWCYESREKATAAIVQWFLADPRPEEPEGWHRHPASGRRRPDGDPAQEYVNL